ncbi:MAG: MBOAT family O-acyltransferase, partial [Microcystaceae cyanobacterium]
ITLSTWFRDYVFLPLMGSNKKWAPFYLFLTFTLSGFWHGAAWNFIIWGAYHGALLLAIRYLGRPFYGVVGKYLGKAQFISWLLTMASVIFGCFFFMDTNSRRLLTKLLALLNPFAYSWGNLTSFWGGYNINELTALGITLFLALGVLFLEHLAIWQKKFEYEWLLNRWMSPILLGLTILLAAQSQSEFIYFEF